MVKNFLKKNKNILFLCAFNVILELVVLLFFVPYYETNDDMVMGNIAAGSYGTEFGQYVIFSNILYGYLLKFLGLIIPALNWYVAMQYILIGVSMICLGWYFLKHFSLKTAFFLNVLCWFIFAFEIVRLVQWTRTAGLLMTVGFLLLLEAIRMKRVPVKILGFLLVIFGALIRFEDIVICLPFFGVLAFIFWLWEDKMDKGMFKRYLLNFLLLLVVLGGAKSIDILSYSLSEQWRDYTEFNRARAAVIDYGVPPYDEYEEQYQEIGFSRNDTLLLSKWCFADNEKFTSENLQKIAAMREPKEINLQFIGDFARFLLEQNYNSMLFRLYLALFVFALFKNRRTLAFYGITLVLFCGLNLILYYIGRVPLRVEFVILISAVFSNISFMLRDSYSKLAENRKDTGQWKVVLAIAVFAVFSLSNHYLVQYRDMEYPVQPRQFLENLGENQDNIYMLSITGIAQTYQYCYKPWRREMEPGNLFFMGTWLTKVPFYEKMLDEMELENPMHDLILKDNFYYVTAEPCGYPQVELTFLQENYDSEAKVRQVGGEDGYNIWQFYAPAAQQE